MDRQETYNELALQMQSNLRSEIIKFNNILITLYTSLTSVLVFFPFNVTEDRYRKGVYIGTLISSALVLLISLSVHFAYIQHKSATLNNLGKFFKDKKNVGAETHIELPGTFAMTFIYWVRRIQIILIGLSVILGVALGWTSL